jgi:anti-anti-sigma regulatory factor
MVSSWEEREVSPGTSLIAVDGKLRGSRARQLMEQLEEIASRRGLEKVSRVILDLREVVSIDSLGTVAFESALEGGLKLDLVLRRGFELDDGREGTELAQRGLRVHEDLAKVLNALPVAALT